MKKLLLAGLGLYLVNGTIFHDEYNFGSINQPFDDHIAVENFVNNGDFENFDLKGHQFRNTGDFPGWWVKKGEVGFGKLYNKHWPSHTKVIELDSHGNVDYKAKINLPSVGQYRLTFNYAARDHKPLQTSSFVVKINGKAIKISPVDY